MTVQEKIIEQAQKSALTGAAAQLVEHYAEAAVRLPAAAEPWVRSIREAGIAVVRTSGLPHRRVEEWKYTDLRAAMPQAFPPANPYLPVSAADLEVALGPLAAVEGPRAVFINSEFAPAHARLATLAKGAGVHTMRHLLANPQAWMKDRLGQINPQKDAVAAINSAFMTDGAGVRVAAGVKLTEPIHLVFVTAGGASAQTAIRNMIVLEEGAEAVVIETYITVGDTPAQTYAVTEVDVAASAKLTQIKYSGEALPAQHMGNWHVKLASKADYLALQYNDSPAIARHQLFVHYAGEGTRAHFTGAQLLRGKQHCDMTMVIDHAVPGCESREHVKAVLAGEAQGVFQAKVLVRQDAQQTDGRQMAQALMLSDTCEFDAKPELEIYADDVKCNHGATVGQLDEDMMFYLRARGIGETEARALLVRAFTGEILEKVEHETLRGALQQRVDAWLAAQ